MKLFNTLQNFNLGNEILKGKFGIEKESLRVNENGLLSTSDHPIIFGDKKKHPFITIDFSESQVELITPPLDSVHEAYDFLQNIHEVVTKNLKEEFLWNQSVPCIIPSIENIPIGKFPNNKEFEIYRKNLAEKYGKEKQLISGIHFNFSLDENVLKKLYIESIKNISDNKNSDNNFSKKDFQEFKNNFYLKISRNYFKYGWLIVYLLGASPVVHKSYNNSCSEKMIDFDDDTRYFENSLSFRNSPCGYKNKDEFSIDYSSLQGYISNIENLIESGILQGVREYYSPIRVKSTNPDLLKGLKETGIDYIEIRSIDLNPYDKIGLNELDLEFVHIFLLYLAFTSDENFSDKDYIRYVHNIETLAKYGRDQNFTLICCDDNNISPKNYSKHLLDEIETFMKTFGILNSHYTEVLEYQKQKLVDGNLYTEKLLRDIKKTGFVNFHISKSKEYNEILKRKEYTLKGYEDLELSTQILLKECILQGIKFEILDRNENFVRIEKDKHVEYIKQATKTSLDSYITTLIMENKVVTKKVLEENNIKTPLGKNYNIIDEAKNDFPLFKDKKIVIKPKSTNFGLGITIFKDSFSQEDYQTALNFAFSKDSSVIIEEFIPGKEYRFLVIGDEVVGILHRVPANVTGNGNLSIEKLVEIKNQDVLRGKGYKTPLEKISLQEPEKLFLKQQGLTVDYIPKKDEVIYLRENSNISTGGDSLDFTDIISEKYKNIAVLAAKAANATICGVDMMITDINNQEPDGNYAIIEINFNPAIHIHSYPYKGTNRLIAKKLLTALGY